MSQAVCANETMSDLLRYIENNLPSDLNTGLLANIGYASHAKLYRSFYSLTGHSVKEYVRKRRLSNALALIKASELSLTDISMRCGYSSLQALCRAVRQTLSVTPSEYKSGGAFYFFPPWNGQPAHLVAVSNVTIPRMLRVLFHHTRLKDIENAAVSTFLQAFPGYGGRIFGRNGKQEGGKFCYELFLTDIGVDFDRLKQFGFEITRETPQFNAVFATIAVKNDETQINAAWNYLYAQWLQNSMFEYTDEPYYEEYMVKNGRPVKLKLYLPIKKRGGETKISLISDPGLRFIVASAEGYNAENIASRTVVDYLSARYSYIVSTSKELYLSKTDNTYICGIRVDAGAMFVDDVSVRCFTVVEGSYLVLESSVTGDYDRYAELLTSFARDNGMAVDTSGIFAIYDASESFDNLKTKMYCPVHFDTK